MYVKNINIGKYNNANAIAMDELNCYHKKYKNNKERGIIHMSSERERQEKNRRKEQIRGKIHRYETERTNLELQIRKLEEKIGAQQSEKKRVEQGCEQYDVVRHKKHGKLEKMGYYVPHVKLVAGHINILEEKIIGTTSANNMQRLAGVIGIMETEISRNISLLEEKQNQLVQYNYQIQNLQDEMRRI